jgi:TolB-like protein/class 3 adenylate cyclase/tetratricopeptide (TPR) repeat protein
LTDNRVERRLAAILAADVAGYSRLTGLDEEGTHVRLRERLRGLADPKISEHRGKVVKHTGDGVLAEFGSVVDAVRCAIDVQRGMAEENATVPQVKRIEFRIGIHVGDIIVDENDIFGDGVNIAARLEGIAEPGGICISDDAQRQIRGKVDVAFEDMGSQNLKNIAEPMRAWRWRINAGGHAAAPIEPPVESTQALALPNKPSIAVLPFKNMSGDPEQEYFADGMTEDITTALSRFKALFVIARNSSFTYRGRAVDIRQVGRELGVRYVLEGSVRKAARRLRITGQLVDTATGAHLWADHFDGTFADIFDLQDRLTATIVGAIAPRVEQAEIERTKRKPTDRLDAYDYYLRGVAGLTIRKAAGARELFLKAVELDLSFAVCYAMAAHCYELEVIRDGLPPAEVIAETTRLARRAVLLGNEDAVALTRAGHALAFVAGEIDEGATLLDRAIVLNPNLALAWHQGGWTKIYVGEPEQAIERFSRAMRLSPLDPLLLPWIQSGSALAHLFAGQYDQAATWAEKALRDGARNPNALRTAAASFALAGRLEEARKVVARFLEVFPDARVSRAQAPFYYLRRPEDLARYVKGLRLAGLPE